MNEATDCPGAPAATMSSTGPGARSNHPGGIRPDRDDNEVTA